MINGNLHKFYLTRCGIYNCTAAGWVYNCVARSVDATARRGPCILNTTIARRTLCVLCTEGRDLINYIVCLSHPITSGRNRYDCAHHTHTHLPSGAWWLLTWEREHKHTECTLMHTIPRGVDDVLSIAQPQRHGGAVPYTIFIMLRKHKTWESAEPIRITQQRDGNRTWRMLCIRTTAYHHIPHPCSRCSDSGLPETTKTFIHSCTFSHAARWRYHSTEYYTLIHMLCGVEVEIFWQCCRLQKSVRIHNVGGRRLE